MAEFCNKCIEKVFPGEKPDIDVYEIFNELKEGYVQPVLCEGCGMSGILKDDYGHLKVIYIDGDNFVEYNREEQQ
ncbi:MAG: hypothetical protein JETCAE03_32420 [Ignavibacteriaceae bacterium]|jgi:hypothetical protein|nr:MAG: hypothetical protein JETCAE03_32420 [Ignavibacteriaceae bacterium]